MASEVGIVSSTSFMHTISIYIHIHEYNIEFDFLSFAELFLAKPSENLGVTNLQSLPHQA